MSFQERMRRTLERAPQEQAIEFGGVWWRWGDVRATALSVTEALDDADVAPNATVAWIARNRPHHLAALFGLLAAGRSVVVVSPFQSADRIAEQIDRLRAPAVVADAEDWEATQIADAVRRTEGLGLALGGGPGGAAAVLARGDRRGAAGDGRAASEQTLTLLTSGTTGPSKRIALPVRAVEAAAEDCDLLEAEGHDPGAPRAPFISGYPLTNIGGIYYAMPTGLLGRRMALLEKFAVEPWVEAVERHRPGLLWLPPAAIRMLLEAGVPRSALAGARALRYGAAPLDDDTRERFEETYGIPVLSQYGATEFAGTVVAWTLADHRRFGAAKRGSIGRARPGIGLRVVDSDTGTELPCGVCGRLEVMVPRVGPGWMSTNDLAAIDDDGFVFLQGRADDAINRGGFKVLSEDVADVLRRHPAVADAAVVGLPDARLGQVPVAAVELRPGATPPDIGALQAFARERLIAYQVPVRIIVVPALPRTPSLKVDRPAVRRLFAPAKRAAAPSRSD